jgi:hypothetical protein
MTEIDLDKYQVKKNYHQDHIVKRTNTEQYGLLIYDWYNTICSKPVYYIDFFDGLKVILYRHEFEEVPEPEATVHLVMNI